MKKVFSLIILFTFCISLTGCAHHGGLRVALSQRIQLGMTKAEVTQVCGKPTQVGAMKKNDGTVIESFIYRQTKYNAWTDSSRTMDTYVYFEDEKVVNYGGEPIAFY